LSQIQIPATVGLENDEMRFDCVIEAAAVPGDPRP
jgi:hypothetical protein